jgi:FAD-linked sulfhydryl oxidase
MTGLSHLKPQPNDVPVVQAEVVHGDHVMGKLGNETLKAELGRAAWKVLHTTMARFPDKPTPDESEALKQYIHLFGRLYPCGECAEHFQQILKKYPPQTSSRSSAAAWTCFVHNLVNERKGKPIFDCANIGDFYDCGCADDEKDAIAAAGAASSSVAQGAAAPHEKVEIETEGPTKGG